MKHALTLFLLGVFALSAQAQHIFRNISLSDALVALDESSKRYDISFVYDELEDFTVCKTIKRECSLPDAVREVCGFYPVRVTVKGREIFVECIQKERTKLTGRLLDSERQPVAYANITLFHPSDSTYIGGGVSNEAGDFVIPCGAKLALVRISCVGFKPLWRTMPISRVGTIYMQMENTHLPGIIINSHLPVIRSEAGRIIYIVANDPFSKGQSAFELLNRVPMVNINNNQASILGKGDAHFMLNGRVMDIGNEAIRQKLWSLQSEDIERIEVISLPSGRYQTEAGGGYINIVLNHDQTLGWRGDVTGELKCNQYLNERLVGSVNYASKKFDMSIGVDGDWNRNDIDNRTLYTFSFLNRTSNNHQEYSNNNWGANTMCRFQPYKWMEMGAILSYRLENSYMDITDETHYAYKTVSAGSQKPDEPTHTLSITSYLDFMIDSIGKKLGITYNLFKKDDKNSFNISDVETENYNPFISSCESESKYRIQSVKLDLSLPFSTITIDGGVSYTTINNRAQVHNERTFEDKYGQSNTYVFESFDYQEKTIAAYLSYQQNITHSLLAKAGIRFERTSLEGLQGKDGYTMYEDSGHSMERKDKNNRYYYNYFPSVFLNYNFANRQQISLGWNMSIIRPDFYSLNPFKVYSSAISIKTGNPSLLPSITNNVELNYNNGHGLYATAYYHHGHDMIEWITAFNPYVYLININAPYYMLSYPMDIYSSGFDQEIRPFNCYDSDKTGIFLQYQHQLTTELKLGVEGEAYYYHAIPGEISTESFDFYKQWTTKPWMEGGINGIDFFKISIPNVHGWGERIALSADYFLNRSHSLMLSARYDFTFANYIGLTEYDNYGNLNMALRYSLLNDRLALSLVVNDLFNQQIFNTTRLYDKSLFNEYSHMNPHAQSVSLTASYSLGGKKVRRIHRDTDNTESQRAEKK